MAGQTKKFIPKRAELEVGDRIVVLTPVENGLIRLRRFDSGTIIYLQNQVEATVWFRHLGQYAKEGITEALKLDVAYGKDGKMDGLAVRLKRSSFAVVFQYGTKFGGEVVEEYKAIAIPFFKQDDTNENRIKSNFSRNAGGGEMEPIYQYPLQYVIDVVAEGFEEWVKKNTKSRKIKKSEKRNGDYPEDWDTCLTEESSNLFHKKKEEVELAFAKATGIFVEFTGGLLSE